jgi:hypothetical protein
LTVESSRNYGPFDRRHALIVHKHGPVSLRREGEERGDWDGFVGRFFPGSRRHDLDALAAYQSYCTAGRGRRPADSAVMETDRWESEGGS